MKIYNILISISKDHPGIVDDISTFLYKYDANIEDSRMAALGGCFSTMTLFSIDDKQIDKLREALGVLKERGVETFLHDAKDPSQIQRKPALPLKLEVVSIDHPGIVQQVVHHLHMHKINIRSLNTRVVRAPISGAPLFDLILEANVPEGEHIEMIKQELRDLALEMDLDLSFIK